MNYFKVIAALVCAIALSGASCNQREGVAVLPPDKPRLDKPDSTSMRKCALPVVAHPDQLTQEQAEALWGKDVDALIECGRRHQILINFVKKRDGGLGG